MEMHAAADDLAALAALALDGFGSRLSGLHLALNEAHGRQETRRP